MLTFLSYAVNGRGVGHLTRQVAIQKWLRRYLTVLNVSARHYILTTSEADQIATREGFATFKMPSKSVVREAGIHKPAYLALAKQWVWHSLGLLRPDVLIVDTFPEGSFHELPAALDLAKKRVLISRPVKDEFIRNTNFASAASLYDQVLVPAAYDEAITSGTRLGPLTATEPFEAFSRQDARHRLGIDDDKVAVLITGGGGGDEMVAELFAGIETHEHAHLVFAAGPLYRGAPRRGPGITWFAATDLARHLRGIDLAVSACGFNSAHELMTAAVPTIFLPQQKVADDQRGRARYFVDKGAALSADLPDLPEVLRALVRSQSARQKLREGARALANKNHARDFAREILDGLVDESDLDWADTALTDAVLASPFPLGDIAALASHLDGDLDEAIVLLQAAEACHFGAARVTRLSRLLARRVDCGLSAVALTMMRHPLAFGQSATLISLVQLLTAAKGILATEVESAIGALFDDYLSAGKTLADLVHDVAKTTDIERPMCASFLRSLGEAAL